MHFKKEFLEKFFKKNFSCYLNKMNYQGYNIAAAAQYASNSNYFAPNTQSPMIPVSASVAAAQSGRVGSQTVLAIPTFGAGYGFESLNHGVSPSQGGVSGYFYSNSAYNCNASTQATRRCGR